MTRASSTPTHSVQAMCRDGTAANRSACSTIGEPQDPQVRPSVTVSMKPRSGISRGGMTGYSAKQASPPRLSMTKALRAVRYRSGCRRNNQVSRASALAM
ncbi:hypothetical protein LUX73_39030 [Actinomadura madurae]|nr:hypothetical protein [Actinomadura madurae]MCQ0010106.1 hypothetical protein [Actinomadura madurae]